MTRYLTVFLVFAISSFSARSMDIIKINDNPSMFDVRGQYINDLLITALDLTLEEFGEYKVVALKEKLPNIRVQQEVNRGRLINLAIAVVSRKWEESTIPIYIPLRQGVLNYRLLLVNKQQLEQFENVTSLELLKSKSVGLRRSWSTRTLLKSLGFNVVDTYSYDALFEMLHKQRFDYTVRGVHEVYDEISLRKHLFDDLVIVPGVALYIPAPTYFFVAPDQPRIAKRLWLGLEKMVISGELENKFNKTYGHYVKQADLKNRKIINIGNPFLSDRTPWKRKELWLDFDLPTAPAQFTAQDQN